VDLLFGADIPAWCRVHVGLRGTVRVAINALELRVKQQGVLTNKNPPLHAELLHLLSALVA
jgi:hypothetical protein